MPIIHIHKVTSTIGKAIDYGKSDKIEKSVDKDDIADTVNYASNDKTGEVIFKTLTSYHNSKSRGVDFTADCRELLERYPRKREVRENEKPALLFHIVQGFDGYIPPTLANQIGMELAEEYLGRFAVQVSTHTNTENIHNHIIFCAVDLDGNRYNDCDSTYAELRKVSDKICEKYGLDILEGTREYKPIHWTDKDGNRHSFEPTNRKIDLIEKRKNGEISPDDVSSYRNSMQYQISENEKKTQKEIIADDIRTYLPLANSYEHLLAMLRENLGYAIKDKKKDGDYLEHIVFTHPLYSKGVRDNSLDSEGYFTRENLEKIIAENEKMREFRTERIEDESHGEKEQEFDFSSVQYHSTYDYSKFDLSTLDEDKRAWKREDGSTVIYKRGNPEKSVIGSAKTIENDSLERLQTFGFKSSHGKYILHHANDDDTKTRYDMSDEQFTYAKTRAMMIQERLNCLRFLEENNLYNYKRVNSVMESFWSNYNSSYEKLNEVGARLEKLRFICGLPNMIEHINKRMEENAHNSDYINNELEHDRMLVQKYKTYLSERGLDKDPQKVAKLESDLATWEQKYNELSVMLKQKKDKLLEYERSIEILKESARGSSEEYNHTWSEYATIQSRGKEQEIDNDRVRQKQENNKSNKER